MTSSSGGPVAECVALVREGHLDVFVYRAWRLPPADLADVIHTLNPAERRILLETLPARLAARGLAELPSEATPSILLSTLTTEFAADIIQVLDDDAAAALLGGMATPARERILATVASRASIDRLLQHRNEAAGRMMTSAVLTVNESDPIPLAVEAVRRQARDVGEAVEIYVVDLARRLTGVLSFQQLVMAPQQAVVRDIMKPAEHTVAPDLSRKAVVRALQRYRLAAIPVVDHDGRLVGCITADDGAHIAANEARGTFLHFAGVVGEEEARSTVGAAVRSRLPTLYGNLLAAFLAVVVLYAARDASGRFHPALLWLPVLAGIGGNAGIQALASAQHRLAQGRLPWNRRRVLLGREMLIGILNGALIGTLVAVTAILVGASWQVGLILLLAMILTLTLAGVLAAVLPMLLRRTGFDPSLASAPTLIAILDVLGLGLLVLLTLLFK